MIVVVVLINGVMEHEKGVRVVVVMGVVSVVSMSSKDSSDLTTERSPPSSLDHP